ncbi:unnamed protein product, partial [Didymodactylos carnosus]
MDLSQKFCEKCSVYCEDNEKLRILNTQKQEENLKLIYDLSLAKAECEKENKLRTDIEQKLHNANKLAEQDHYKRLQKFEYYSMTAASNST